jgi:ankyrin repeat protein
MENENQPTSTEQNQDSAAPPENKQQEDQDENARIEELTRRAEKLIRYRPDVQVTDAQNGRSITKVAHLKELIEAGADVNGLVDGDASFITCLGMLGDVACIKYLCEEHAEKLKVDVRDHFGSSALIYLVRCNAPWLTPQKRLEGVKALLKVGANVNGIPGQNVGNSVMWAVSQNFGNIVSVLLEHGGDPNAHSYPIGTPLHYACTANSETMVSLLLKYNANVEAKRMEDNYTPLHCACEAGNASIVQRLLTALIVGAQRRQQQFQANQQNPTKNQSNNSGNPINTKGAEANNSTSGAPGNVKNPLTILWETPMHIAAKCNFPQVVQVLLNNGCAPDSLRKDRLTPFLLAARTGSLPIMMSIWRAVENLPVARKVFIDNNYPNALLVAGGGGHVEAVLWMLKRGPFMHIDHAQRIEFMNMMSALAPTGLPRYSENPNLHNVLRVLNNQRPLEEDPDSTKRKVDQKKLIDEENSARNTIQNEQYNLFGDVFYKYQQEEHTLNNKTENNEVSVDEDGGGIDEKKNTSKSSSRGSSKSSSSSSDSHHETRRRTREETTTSSEKKKDDQSSSSSSSSSSSKTSSSQTKKSVTKKKPGPKGKKVAKKSNTKTTQAGKKKKAATPKPKKVSVSKKKPVAKATTKKPVAKKGGKK